MTVDKLTYFNIRARGEAIRMLYSLTGKDFIDDVVHFADWPARKPGKFNLHENSPDLLHQTKFQPLVMF